jgi:hypothetical protein
MSILNLYEPDDLVAFGTIVLAIFTLLLAIFTYMQVRHISRNQKNLNYIKFLDEYAKPKMRLAFREIEKFYKDNDLLCSQLNSIFECSKQKTPLDSSKIEAASEYLLKHEHIVEEHRARIAWFFHKAWKMYCYGFIDENTMQWVCKLDGAKTFINIVCPLTLAIRLSRIHKGDIHSFHQDENVLWYTNFELKQKKCTKQKNQYIYKILSKLRAYRRAPATMCKKTSTPLISL